MTDEDPFYFDEWWERQRSMIGRIHCILPYLYLTDLVGAHQISTWKSAGITCIITMCALEDDDNLLQQLQSSENIGVQHHYYNNIEDAFDVDILTVAEQIHQIIIEETHSTGKNGKVLIHCAMGVSRSVSAIIYHLIRSESHRMNPKEALALIRKQRPIAEPNDAFMAQLESYYHSNHNAQQNAIESSDNSRE